LKTHKLDLGSAYALVTGIYERHAGESVTLAAKVISNDLLSGKPASHDVSRSAQSVRLGILLTFALFVASLQDKGLGIIVTNDEQASAAYKADGYGKASLTAADFLGMFGITPYYGNDVDEVMMRNEKHAYTVGPLITERKKLRQLMVWTQWREKLVYPVIDDDGSTVKQVDINTYNSSILY